MLGSGRPFVLEVKNPRRRTADLAELRAQVNDSEKVEVEALAFATHETVARVKELDATKTYRATVEFDDAVADDEFAAALSDLDGVAVDQRTPNRVDHRRADRVRERRVLSVDGRLEDGLTAVVDVHGEGGLYIKELMSGEIGRAHV